MKKPSVGLLLVLTIAAAGCEPGPGGPGTGGSSSATDPGHGYTREGDHIRFKGRRIDRQGASDIGEFSVALRREVELATDVDAASFEALSEEYSKDASMVYYKWISGSDFWVVQVPGADPASFEVLGFNLARDKSHVWIEDQRVAGADPATARSLYGHRVWLDANNVYHLSRIVPDADPATFKAYGNDYHYHDDKQVYLIFAGFEVVEGAEPKTFVPPSFKP